MVNPTGYTALDMIGFTDKGTYSSSDNYVKNDLVHYSGNIWRCLIDDTSGIAPAEGVNWTLFIGEPTNLVERIIALVETDPATNSLAVGRQIIFNDNLYEVIAAITAGDSLVTYEDDPTNANIKLADPVETQLLNEESTRAAADLALQNNLSNRNLLDNAWFTVNQRGQSSYPNRGYTVDRWYHYSTSMSVEVIDNGIRVTSSDAATELHQLLEAENIRPLLGKTITISCLLIDGTLYSDTFEMPDTMPSASSILSNFTELDSNGDWQMSLAVNAEGLLNFRIRANTTISSASVSIDIRAVKLEIGSISTLAMDTAPNYAEELLKCQRYFQTVAGNTRLRICGYSANAFRATLNIPTPMAAAPSLSNATLELRSLDENTTLVSTSQGVNRNGESLLLYATYTAHGLTDGQLHVPSNETLWISAEL